MYLLAGFVQNWLIMLPVGMVVTVAALVAIKRVTAVKA
jgi:hypothetical protein